MTSIPTARAIDFPRASTLVVASQADARPLTAALVGSLLAHALLVIALVTGVSESPRRLVSIDGTALRATLASPQPTIFQARATAPASADPILHEPIRATPLSAAAFKAPASLLRNPFPPPKPEPVAQSLGRVTITSLNEPLDPMFAQVLGQIYPNAVQSDIQFEVPPSARYPNEAMKDRRQAHIRVLVIVRGDGHVQLAEGSLHDPMFTTAVRTALRQSRATLSFGDPFQLRYTMLLFIFEYTGSN